MENGKKKGNEERNGSREVKVKGAWAFGMGTKCCIEEGICIGLFCLAEGEKEVFSIITLYPPPPPRSPPLSKP